MMDNIELWIILDNGLSWMIGGIELWIMDDNNMAGG